MVKIKEETVTTDELKAAITKAADRVANEHDADVLLINEGIGRNLDDRVISQIVKRNRRPNVLLILVTEGGDPDTAYRIARALQEYYENFTAVIAGYCKSAGTLCVLGANQLAFGVLGELGPLDVQYAKKDDLGEFASGLVVREAIGKIQEEAFGLFERVMLGIMQRSDGQISFRLASDVATRFTTKLFEPLARQIDPVLLGDLERGLTIAKDYGERLRISSGNFTEESLSDLADNYSSHGFVIDQREAEQLFKNVRSCIECEQELLDILGDTAVKPSPRSKGLTRFISTEIGVIKDEIHDKANGEFGAPEANVGRGKGSDATNNFDAETESQSGVADQLGPQENDNGKQAGSKPN